MEAPKRAVKFSYAVAFLIGGLDAVIAEYDVQRQHLVGQYLQGCIRSGQTWTGFVDSDRVLSWRHGILRCRSIRTR